MKYNKAIDVFLTHIFEPHEVESEETYASWEKNGKTLAEVDYLKKNFVVFRAPKQKFQDYFSMDWEETRKHIKTWIDMHYELFDFKVVKTYNA